MASKRSAALGCLALALLAAPPSDPRFTKDGELIRPADYREWIYLTSGLGMSYGVARPTAESPRFDNVFVLPASYKAFLETGKWPDKTIFILEVRKSDSHVSINKSGLVQSEIAGIEAAVKDESRFKEKWAYVSFDRDKQVLDSAKPFAGDSACNVCHSKNGAVENTFVQFYPTLLEVARAKGTLKASFQGAAATGAH